MTHGGDDAVGLALPERDLAASVNDDVVGLASCVGAHNLLHALDLGQEGLLVVVRVQGHLALLQRQGHSRLGQRGSGLRAHGDARAATSLRGTVHGAWL